MVKAMNCLFVMITFLSLSCSNDAKVKSTNEEPASTVIEKEPESNQETVPEQGDGIVGGWDLVLEAYDDIDNNILDEEERKKGKVNKYNYRFKADGKCTIQKSYNGEYEMQDVNGKKMITIYLYDEGKKTFDSKYYINSVNRNELVLLEEGGNHVFWVFKRE